MRGEIALASVVVLLLLHVLLVLLPVPTLPQLPLPPLPAATIPSMLPACVTTDVGTLESCTTTSEAVVDRFSVENFMPKAAAVIIAAGGCVTSVQWTAAKKIGLVEDVLSR